ncbi:hypothetical protein KY331_04945 [Candidatus Woesearchaeota archaeon]|nr:hypothetical protein [Candidatus Woesearchaeota archaeon]
MYTNLRESAKKIVDAIVARKQNPRDRTIRPNVLYHTFASQLNGGKKKFDQLIYVEAIKAQRKGADINPMFVVDCLNESYENLEEQRREFAGDPNEDLGARLQVTEAELEKRKKRAGTIGKGTFDPKYEATAEARLDVFFTDHGELPKGEKYKPHRETQ